MWALANEVVLGGVIQHEPKCWGLRFKLRSLHQERVSQREAHSLQSLSLTTTSCMRPLAVHARSHFSGNVQDLFAKKEPSLELGDRAIYKFPAKRVK